jgi:uncharacterized Zn-binding protein involved in type VI secretion
MPASTIVNGLTVIHARSGGIATNGPPDVCLTPPTPEPVPYPNIAFSNDLANGSRTVTVDGLPIALSDSEFSTSTGDEGGTAGGGVVSHVIKGKAKFLNSSPDVKVEGKGVCRLSEPMSMNGNAPNTTCPAEVQGNIMVLGPKVAVLCTIFCWCDQDGAKGSDVIQIISGDTA